MRTRTLTAAATAGALALIVTGCSEGAHLSLATSAAASPTTLATSAPQGGSTFGPTVTTTGVGTVRGSPDTLNMDIDVSTRSPHAADALAQNNLVVSNVQRVLRNDGVAAADIQTSGLSLQLTDSSSPASYQVDDSVTATLRTLASAGTVIDDAVATAGDAGRLSGVDLSISDTSPLMSAARQQAVAAARADAEQLVSVAGEHLGALVSLTDQLQQVYPQNLASPSGGPARSDVPVQGGTQQLSVNVTAVWAINP